MQVSLTDAKGRLTDLVKRAEAGDEIILTRHGKAAVRLVPVKPAMTSEAKATLIKSVRAEGRLKATSGESAARSQDFLYDDDGLPA